jgi:ankyrin repeat protein
MVTTPNISAYLSVFPAEIWLLIIEQMAAPDLLSLCCANKTYHGLCVPFLFKLGIEFSQNWRCSCPEPVETWPESKLAFDNCSCRPESPVQWAIRHNHVSTLSAFLHHGLPINAAYKSAWSVLDPCSLLNLTIGYQRTDAVQLLLDNGADVSFSYGVDGHTAQILPLLMASFGQLHFQDTKITRLLPEHGADVHVINPWEISLLTFAIDIDSYAKLLAQGVDINRLNGRGQPNLFARVWYQEGDLVEFILSQNGIDPNIPELQRGWTPLHCAIDMVVTNRRTYHRRTSVLAKLLLKSGASPNIRNYANLTAADYLITPTTARRIPERVTILKSMIEVGLDYTPRGLGSNSLIHWACRGTHIHGLAFLKPLIENATPEQLNDASEDGYTALHLATLDNDLKLVRLLIKNGADANLLDGGGRAAIHMAANRHSLMMFVELCKYANPHAVCALGYTALHYVFVNWRDFKKIHAFTIVPGV